MTLGTTTPLIEYVENGATLVHAVPFQFQVSADLVCSRIAGGVETTLTLGVHYTVTGGAGGAGSVTKTSGGVAGTVFRIKRHTGRDQPTDYTPGDPFPAETHEDALDRLAAVNQEQDVAVADVQSRALRVPVGEVVGEIPAAGARGLKFLSFTALGAPTVSDPPAVTNVAGQAVNSKALLAAIAAPIPGQAAFLTLPGAEGMFVWDGSNLQTKVTGDTQKGVYVPPTGGNGSTGAWVRKFSGALNVKWFGATGDGATDDSAAFQAALAFVLANGQVGVYLGFDGNGVGCQEIYVPQGTYNMVATTLDIRGTIRLRGAGVGHGGGPASVLKWTGNVTGLRLQKTDTVGAGGASNPTGLAGADGSIIEGLFLAGAFTAAESEAHGLHFRVRPVMRDCVIYGFAGDGLYSDVIAGGNPHGNANNFHFEHVTVVSCRRGIFLDGADTNAGTVIGCDFSSNRQAGVYDSSFLGNTYSGVHTSNNANGLFGNGTTTPVTMVSQGGNYYSLATFGNKTVAPSGIASDTANWIYVGPGAPFTTAPAWSAGVNVRVGAPYIADNANARSTFLNCYSEGSQPVSQIEAPAIIVGGLHGAGIVGSGHWYTQGGTAEVYFGYQRGAPRDFGFSLNSTGTLNSIAFFSCTGVATRTLIGVVRSNTAGFGLELHGEPSIYFKRASDGSEFAQLDANGLNVKQGNAYKINGVKVVGAQQVKPAVPTLADVVACLSAHGLWA
jgi:hypothetical protein